MVTNSCRISVTSFLLILLSVISFGKLNAQTGSLVIAGGALTSTNSEIFHKFIALAGGNNKATIGIVAAASEKPVTYGNTTRQNFIQHGVDSSRIFILPIACVDDLSTPDDESKWVANVSSNSVVELISKCSGIWFTGGDQMRITSTLAPNNTETAALKAIRNVYATGGVVGGTSAGAAIMSEIMIAAGSSLEGLRYGFTNEYSKTSQQEEGKIHLSSGLGFLKNVIIDQHFDRKARIGRLVMSTFENKSKNLLGYGVDENTALIVMENGKTGRVIGEGGVTIVNTRETIGGKTSDGQFWFKKIRVSYIEAGDMVEIPSCKITPNPLKKSTIQNEYFSFSNKIAGGTLHPNGLFKHQLSYLLVDNQLLNEVKSYSFFPDGKGFEITLRKDSLTKGYWAYLGDEVDRYTVIDAEMEITPVDISIQKKSN